MDSYTGGMESIEYYLKKLDFCNEEFDGIMSESPKSFKDYKSYHSLIKALKTTISWGNKVGIVPDTVYKKYFSFDI